MDSPKIVIVEDEHIVALDIKLHLEKFGYSIPATYTSGEDILKNIATDNPDLVLMDIRLQGSLDGVETSLIIREQYNIPVILLTAYADDATIERAKITEPFAYLIKPFEERELRTAIIISLHRHRIDKELRRREQLFSTTLRSIEDAVCVVGSDGVISFMNPAAEKLFEITEADWQGKTLESTVSMETYQSDLLPAVKERYYLINGKFVVTYKKTPLETGVNNMDSWVHAFHDISAELEAQKALIESEMQLRHSQKMEAVGRLSGGIAHDFNNLLTVIMGYSKLLLESIEDDSVLKADIEGIQKAALKSVSLTRQLLTFSRQQLMEMKVVDANKLLKDMDKMIRRLIREDISVLMTLRAMNPKIYIDQGQIEQVLVNLVVNARDAMADGGMLSIKTHNRMLTQDEKKQFVNIPKGDYLVISVSDSGVGMEVETLSKIFEPFFTTKGRENGTGLGLSTAYGIVKQSGGYVDVESNPGKGTNFDIYLPVTEKREDLVEKSGQKISSVPGTETILLVEDDEFVRSLLNRMLMRQGYNILDAPNAGEALLICEEYNGDIQLVISDVILPHLNGKKLSKRLLALRPNLKILFVSGYPESVVREKNLLEEGDHLLQKPFDLDKLTAKIREVLKSE